MFMRGQCPRAHAEFSLAFGKRTIESASCRSPQEGINAFRRERHLRASGTLSLAFGKQTIEPASCRSPQEGINAFRRERYLQASGKLSLAFGKRTIGSACCRSPQEGINAFRRERYLQASGTLSLAFSTREPWRVPNDCEMTDHRRIRVKNRNPELAVVADDSRPLYIFGSFIGGNQQSGPDLLGSLFSGSGFADDPTVQTCYD